MIREFRDQRPFDGSPGLIAVFHALRRLLAPRHPPHALSSLAALIPRSGRVATPGSGIASNYRPPRYRGGQSNDPFSLSGSCRDSQETTETTPGQRRRRVLVSATLTATELSKNVRPATPAPAGTTA